MWLPTESEVEAPEELVSKQAPHLRLYVSAGGSFGFRRQEDSFCDFQTRHTTVFRQTSAGCDALIINHSTGQCPGHQLSRRALIVNNTVLPL
jgi:hypothetical protein